MTRLYIKHKTRTIANFFSILFIDLEVELRLSALKSFINSEFQLWFLKQTHNPTDYLHCAVGCLLFDRALVNLRKSHLVFRVFLLYEISNSDKQLAKPVSFLFRACSKGRLSVWGGNPGAKGQRRKIKQSQSCFIVAMVAFGCVMMFDVLLFWSFTCLSSFFSPL